MHNVTAKYDFVRARPWVLSLDDCPEILTVLRMCMEGEPYEFWTTDDEAAAMCLLNFAERIDLFTQDLDAGRPGRL